MSVRPGSRLSTNCPESQLSEASKVSSISKRAERSEKQEDGPEVDFITFDLEGEGRDLTDLRQIFTGGDFMVMWDHECSVQRATQYITANVQN